MEPKAADVSGLAGKSREDLLEEIQRLKAALQKQEQAARSATKHRVQIGLFLTRVGLRTFAGSQLFQKTIDLWNAWSTWIRSGETSQWPESSTRDFAAALLVRFTRIGLFLVVVATLPFVITLVQLIVLVRQNDLIEQQTELSEATRRSALILEQTAILDEIDEELDSLNLETSNSDRLRLSPRLEGRIVALSTVLRPYRYLEGEKLISRPLSPERGQLLIALVNSRIDFSRILAQAVFTDADLHRTRIREFDFGVDVLTPDSVAPGVVITSESAAGFAGVSFRRSSLEKGSLRRATLRGADFGHADLLGVDFRGADLERADFSYADLLGVDLTDANLDQVTFEGARIGGSVISPRTSLSDSSRIQLQALGARLCRARAILRTRISAELLVEMMLDEKCARRLRLKHEVLPLE